VPFDPKRILVATDYSAPALAAADAALALARGFGARVTLLHAIPLSTYVDTSMGAEGTRLVDFDVQGLVRADALQAGERERARLSEAGVPVTFDTVDGPAAQEICAYAAERGFDLIVVGGHGRTGVMRFLLGSVAERVVRHAAAPVLVVRGRGAPADPKDR